MAGGLGSRLYPLTFKRPKPMVPLVNKPVLAHILNLLKQYDINEVVLTVHHLADQIRDYFGDGRHFGMTLHYAIEDTPLGTAGSVKNAQPYLDDETFIVISGDIVTDIDLAGLVQFHRAKQAVTTLALTHVSNPRQYGVVITDKDGYVRQYLEKPICKILTSHMVNTGIYVFEPKILDLLEPGIAFDFSYDLFPMLLSQKAPLVGYQASGYWRDMGTLESYIQTLADVVAGKVNHIQPGDLISDKVWANLEVDMTSNIGKLVELQRSIFSSQTNLRTKVVT